MSHHVSSKDQTRVTCLVASASPLSHLSSPGSILQYGSCCRQQLACNCELVPGDKAWFLLIPMGTHYLLMTKRVGRWLGAFFLTLSLSTHKSQNITFPQKFWRGSFRVLPQACFSVFPIRHEVHSDLLLVVHVKNKHCLCCPNCNHSI